MHEIAAQVKVGMVEEDARAMASDPLSAKGMRKGWHHVIVRFGPNTTKDFMEPSEKGVVLGSDDIFFIDIGPVFRDHEGDAGDTYVFGADIEHHRAKSDVRAIWNDVREEWFRHGLTGRDLYDYAEKAAAERDGDSTGIPLDTACRSSPIRPTTTVRWRPWTSARRRCCGSWRLPSSIRSESSAPSTKICCSKTSPSTEIAALSLSAGSSALHWCRVRTNPKHNVSIFSLVGFECATALGDEAKDPLKTIPRAVVMSLLISMVEEEAVEMARDILAEAGMFRGWHDVSSGSGRIPPRRSAQPPDPGVVLGADDIFLIDIGPVFEKWEGDGGDTYSFAVAEARRMGWELNMDLSGHRISEFPHEAHHPGPLAEVDSTPSAGPLWVLEIHVRHPTEKYGAFYEDILLDDSYFPDFKA